MNRVRYLFMLAAVFVVALLTSLFTPFFSRGQAEASVLTDCCITQVKKGETYCPPCFDCPPPFECQVFTFETCGCYQT